MSALTKQEALKLVAETIWKSGEHNKKYCASCILPYDLSDNKKQSPVDKTLIEYYAATHYHMKWDERGKSVLLTLYSAEAYGATKLTDEMIVFSESVEI